MKTAASVFLQCTPYREESSQEQLVVEGNNWRTHVVFFRQGSRGAVQLLSKIIESKRLHYTASSYVADWMHVAAWTNGHTHDRYKKAPCTPLLLPVLFSIPVTSLTFFFRGSTDLLKQFTGEKGGKKGCDKRESSLAHSLNLLQYWLTW